MTDESDKSLLDQALDLFLYAPVGAALAARELLPDLSERGRQQLTSRVTMARMLGEFAVRQGRVEVEKAYGRAREQATATLQTLGVVPPATDGRGPAPAPTPQSRPARPRQARPAGERRPAAPEAAPSTPPGPPVDTLAVPDYDALSASQVVPRLAGLSAEELDAVRRYETANRARKTILNRIDQLTS